MLMKSVNLEVIVGRGISGVMMMGRFSEIIIENLRQHVVIKFEHSFSLLNLYEYI